MALGLMVAAATVSVVKETAEYCLQVPEGKHR
jgi:hypothetical protein